MLIGPESSSEEDVEPFLSFMLMSPTLKKLAFSSPGQTSAALSLVGDTLERLEVDYIPNLAVGVPKPHLRHLSFDVRECNTAFPFLPSNVPQSLQHLEIVCYPRKLADVCDALHNDKDWKTPNMKQLTVRCESHHRSFITVPRTCNVAKLAMRCTGMDITLDIVADGVILVNDGTLHSSIPESCADCHHGDTTSESSDEEEPESS